MAEHKESLFEQVYRVILLSEPDLKCAASSELLSITNASNLNTASSTPPLSIETPGLPETLKLVAPRELKKRSIQTLEGRLVLMHAIAHIEFNAINLALDAAYRFREQPDEYYRDWIKVAIDEARHFQLIQEYLTENGVTYGDFPAHNGLWDMALKTQHDVVARMALVPRVMEARGLDVTPPMIEKLKHIGDNKAVNILTTIYNDEIEHVRIGSKWFQYQCVQRDLNSRETFVEMINTHLHGKLKGPFNEEARLLAGFDSVELALLDNISS
jgi:uncharacterized ferritin-like protein (DUF455 family)